MNCSCVFVPFQNVDYANVKRRKTEETEETEAVTLLTCCECQKTIQIGEKFRKEKIEYFRFPTMTQRTCMDCVSIRDEFFCDGWIYGDVLEYLREHINELDGEISEDCLIALTPKAREVVCEMIERW